MDAGAEVEIDIEDPTTLTRFLRDEGRIGASEEPEIVVLAGGVSNRTVSVTRPSGEAWVLKQALAKLRVPVDWFSDPERVHREALGMKWLVQLAPPGTITPFLFEDPRHHILAMEAVPQPHENWKTMLLAGELEADHVEQFGTLLGTIHRRASERVEELMPVFGDRSYFESLRLEPYYGYSARQVPEAAAFLNSLIAATRARQDTLTHGDYSPKNVLVHEGRLVLLDHEVIHFGEPAFDLGFSLTHLLSKAHHLPAARDAFAQAADTYWSVYKQEIGDVPWVEGLEKRAVQHTLGCLLARVAGRSTLEYLDEDERGRQQHAVLANIRDVPASVPELIERFLDEVEK